MLNFQDLYEAFAPDVYRFAFWLAGDEAEAGDITAETICCRCTWPMRSAPIPEL